MQVQHLLEASASLYPAKEALICGDVRLTYAELDQRSNRLAHALRDLGLQRGDRVCIVLDNSPEVVIAIFAVLKADGVFVVLPTDIKPEKLRYLLDDAEPVVVVSDHAHMARASDVVRSAHSVRGVVWAGQDTLPLADRQRSLTWHKAEAFPAEQPEQRSIDVDLAALIYTSGSTGQAKGVMSTHANILAATTSINGYLHNRPDDRILSALPLSFDYGLYQLFLAFQAGACVVLTQGFAFPAATVALMAQEHVTALPGVPTLFALLLKYPALLPRIPVSLRYITNTAAALPTRHIQELRAAFPTVQLFSMYGLTECKRVSYMPPEELDRRPHSVGVAIPNTEVYVVDAEGHRLPPGEIGELVVRGSHVMRGYWRAPELTAVRYRPGPVLGEHVLYTGDLFRVDTEGYLYFVGRKDDIIKSRGEKVSPREVENAVCQFAGVAAAVVVGVPDTLLGEAVGLAVEGREGVELSEAALRAYCARSLEGFMVPKYVKILASLPRTPNGKVDRQAIAQEFARCAAS